MVVKTRPLRARARLGDDAELAQAMLEQPGMKSWAARLPWLVFVALPPVVSAVVGLALYAAVYFIGNEAAKINAVVPVPATLLVGFSVAAMTAISVLAVPVAATLLALLADRQRLKRLWPLLGIALLLLATPMFGYRFGHHHHGYLSFNYGLVIPNTVEHRGALLAPDAQPCAGTSVRGVADRAAQGRGMKCAGPDPDADGAAGRRRRRSSRLPSMAAASAVSGRWKARAGSK